MLKCNRNGEMNESVETHILRSRRALLVFTMALSNPMNYPINLNMNMSTQRTLTKLIDNYCLLYVECVASANC